MRGLTKALYFLISFSVFFFAGQSCTANEAVAEVRKLLLQLSNEDANVRKKAIDGLAATGVKEAENVLHAYKVGNLYLWKENVYRCEEMEEDDDFNEIAPLTDPLTHEAIVKDGKQLKIMAEDLEEVSANRVERKLVMEALNTMRLFDPDPKRRLAAIKKVGDKDVVATLESLLKLAETDENEKIRYTAKESALLIQLSATGINQDRKTHLAAAEGLGKILSIRGQIRLEELVAPLRKGAVDGTHYDKEQRKVYEKAITKIKNHETFVNRISYMFQGFSLGSVLILMALGLSITFGLMGVINMAHGELMMIGAYATYEIQLLLGHSGTTPVNYYFLIALPVSFLAAAIVGALIELLVVRHLYRRPLESLLATWGVGLILIQIVRLKYGDNIGVNAPEWARGSWEVMQDLNLPYGRMFIIVLTIGCVGLIYCLMNYTPLGLKMRATMQNRDMANSLGVNTRRVDLYTFAFGSGLAGIAGCAWTLIGGVTPDMGQTNFIVDSFLVVVTGGVGKLAGVICSGMGIGVLNKFIEPMEIYSTPVGAIWAKILVLIVIVAFIQFKPAGLFAPKGRLADV